MAKPTVPAELRLAAEAQITAQGHAIRQANQHNQTLARLVHELQVHQIELEMQNETLRQTRMALEQSRDQYVDLYEFAPIGYVTLSASGLIAQINLTGAALLGVERQALQQRRFATLVGHADQDRWHQHFMQAIGSDERFTAEFSLQRGDGTVFDVQLDGVREQLPPDNPVPRSSGDARCLRIALTDISARKAIEGELRLSKARLEEQVAQRTAELAIRTQQAEQANAAKTRVMSSVTHELRTPLHSILGYVGQLRKKASAENDRQLAIVERSGIHLLKLINDLLEYNGNASQIEKLHLDTLSLIEFVTQLQQVGKVLADAGHNVFKVSLAADLPDAVVADEQRLQQIVQNLLGNAFKYTRNGTVTLRVECDEYLGEPPDRSARLRFTVEDSGIGIAPDELAGIFEPFSRGTATLDQSGLGLGLAIARQWVHAMGGEIKVCSTPGHGSRFYFALELPIATPPPVPPTRVCDGCVADPVRRIRLARGPIRLLVVDDIAENRMLLCDLCASWNCETLEAGSGEIALEICPRAAPPIDAVLTDQCLPGMSGWQLLLQLRQRSELADLPVVLISASAQQRPEGFPADLDFDLTLGKPLDTTQLKCFLCQHICAKSPADSHRTTRRPGGTPISAEEWQIFRNLLDLGRLLRIEDWAQELMNQDARHQGWAEQVIDHCRAADLPALERLAASLDPARF